MGKDDHIPKMGNFWQIEFGGDEFAEDLSAVSQVRFP
jgi:hypothetical protein